MSDVIERIRQKLAYLREHEDYDVTDSTWERDFQTISARHHRYHLSAPASKEQVEAFEARHKIALPEDYRRFLLEVGIHGASPGHHLLSPFKDLKTSEEARQLSRDDEWHTFGNIIGNLQQPFPFIDEFAEDKVYALENDHEWDEIEAMLSAGNITICYSGDVIWHELIISGAARGQVWERHGYSQWAVRLMPGEALRRNMPLSPEGMPVTFTRWYEAWLDNDIAVAQAHWQKRGRSVPPLVLTETDERI